MPACCREGCSGEAPRLSCDRRGGGPRSVRHALRPPRQGGRAGAGNPLRCRRRERDRRRADQPAAAPRKAAHRGPACRRQQRRRGRPVLAAGPAPARPAAGRCVTAADSTATPLAASSYLAGHADTGRRLRLTETATEVVETDPATFSFRVLRASASALAGAAVAPYPRGRRPASEFVNGLPERRTGSAEEYFQVDPPHYNAADGPARQSYRVDAGPWLAMPRGRVFYTGRLGLGVHTVAVRTADRAGKSVIRFRWRVVPLPRPVPCRPRPRQACWYPPHLDATHHPMRWDWQIGRVTPLQRTGAQD